MNTEVKEVDEETIRRRNIIIGVVVALIVLGILLYFVFRSKPTTVNKVNADVNYSVKEGSSPTINVVSSNDEQGMVSSNYFDFTVDSKVEDKKIYYEVIIAPKSTNTVSTGDLKVYLTDQSNSKIGDITYYNSLSNSEDGKGKIIYRNVVPTNSDNSLKTDSKDLRLRMWLDEGANTSGNFEFDIYLKASYVANDYVIDASAPISLATSSGSVLTGEKTVASILTESDGVITCVSSSEAIATCSVTGKTLTVNGIAVGSAAITVTQGPGTVYARTGTTSYSIEVTTSKTESKMSLNPDSAKLNVGEETNVEIVTNGDGKITCESSDNNIATCSIDGRVLKVKVVNSGSAIIRVNQEEGETKFAPEGVSFKVTGVEVVVKKKTAAETIGAIVGLQKTPYAKVFNTEDPNNYIWFNNEQWRIIGVYGDNLKIVRAKPIKSDQIFNKKGGSNIWSKSQIKKYLYDNYKTIISDEKSRDMVLVDATWYVGEAKPQSDAKGAYNSSKKDSWTGKIGLITSYEYQYATMTSCWTVRGDEYKKECGSKNWLYKTLTSDKGEKGAWTMTPDIKASRVLRVHPQMFVDDNPTEIETSISPVVFLKKDITVTGGTGKKGKADSFKIEVIETQ